MSLTIRQTEVARLVARGWTDGQIAERLEISENTVGHHVQGAAKRAPGTGRPRAKLTLWVLNVSEDG